MSLHMVTANRLGDGAVVYLDAAGAWSERFADGHTVEGKDAAAALLAVAERSVADRVVVAPYVLDVAAAGDGGATVRPLRYRETIRADGPTVRTEFRTPAPARA